MIRVYLLPIETINGTETVAGIDLIHDAVLLTTTSPEIRKLIMDTTDEEHAQLEALCIEEIDPTQADIDLYHASVTITPPDKDVAAMADILATSPQAITMPQIWEAIRILAKRCGFPS